MKRKMLAVPLYPSREMFHDMNAIAYSTSATFAMINETKTIWFFLYIMKTMNCLCYGWLNQYA
jgi:hypothetical protein